MPFSGVREFLQRLDARGEVRRVGARVDSRWEVGAIIRENYDRQGPALIFDRIDDFKTPLIVGVLATRSRCAAALEVEPSLDAIRSRWTEAFKNPIAPRIVTGSEAPVKAVKPTEVDLFKDPFPLPHWHELDTERGLATLSAVITMDPDTGSMNLGNYLGMVAGKEVVSLTIGGLRHARMHLEKWKKKGKTSMPIAIATGIDPVLNMLSVSGVPADVNDYHVAGGLRGDSVDVVKAETSDLLVPAHAEVVIEGEVPIDGLVDRGPWGDFSGHMLPPGKWEYMNVKAVTHRQDPYFQGTLEGRPPNESTTLRSLGRSLALYEHLRNSRTPGVKDVCVTTGGCGQFHAVVSVKKVMPGLVSDVILTVLGNRTVFVKQCTVVDEDVNPWDSEMVEYATALNVKASRDIQIYKNGKAMMQDLSDTFQAMGETDYVGIDATRKLEVWKASGQEYPHTADPPIEWTNKVRERWPSYGLP